MRPKILIFPAVILTWVALVSAEQPNEATKESPVNRGEEYSQEAILTTLEINHEIWLEAQLAGHSEQADRLESELLWLLNCDIYAHQEEVRQLARELALASLPRPDTSASPAVSDSLTQQLIFKQEVGLLNSKEALYRSLKKTDAVSNKYRLLGDYIDLLRRELEMPRLKLANSRSPLPSEGSAQPKMSPREDKP